ncbi:sensor histidine kinase [Solirubrobacter soli]|uniref:sensor histidine kinase n=1 Tax=Solirubrobacter soli TaxID=363832 RepID=UPI0003FFF94A
MRTRLLGLVGGLLAVVLLALGVPLGMDLASVRTQRVFLDRLNDANRFVQVAQQQGDRQVLSERLARYDEVYGIAVAVLDHNGRIRAASRPGLTTRTATAPVRRLAGIALTGHHGEPPRAVWPWSGAPLVVAQPVITGGDVTGAVVTLSPTQRLRRNVARDWLIVVGGELIALIGCALLASRLTRWILRPVHDLDHTAHAIATGRMAARALDGSGPPELRHLTGSFNAMAANVEKIVQRQRNFLADASHQLRNPLSALLLRLDTLAIGAPEDPVVDAAAKEGRHLAGILERLLELANADETHARPEPVDLTALADERIDAWTTAAEAKHMTLQRTGETTAAILADPVAVASALDVVLDNAIKFAPRDSVVAIHVADGALTVRDEGPGMRADELRRAGDRFWRARRHQNVDGSGLGLAIARALLEQGGGSLELRARRPRGLEAHLRFGGAKPVERGRVQRHGGGLDRGAAVEGGGGEDGAGDRRAALE